MEEKDMQQELVSVPEAAKLAGVARNTMFRAARDGKIKSVKLGRGWFVYTNDIERWKQEVYQPQMALRYPHEDEDNEGYTTDS